MQIFVPILPGFTLRGHFWSLSALIDHIHTGCLYLLPEGPRAEDPPTRGQDGKAQKGAAGHHSRHGEGGMIAQPADGGRGKGADAHLDPAHQGRGRTGIFAKRGQGQR